MLVESTSDLDVLAIVVCSNGIIVQTICVLLIDAYAMDPASRKKQQLVLRAKSPIVNSKAAQFSSGRSAYKEHSQKQLISA